MIDSIPHNLHALLNHLYDGVSKVWPVVSLLATIYWKTSGWIKELLDRLKLLSNPLGNLYNASVDSSLEYKKTSQNRFSKKWAVSPTSKLAQRAEFDHSYVSRLESGAIAPWRRGNPYFAGIYH